MEAVVVAVVAAILIASKSCPAIKNVNAYSVALLELQVTFLHFCKNIGFSTHTARGNNHLDQLKNSGSLGCSPELVKC